MILLRNALIVVILFCCCKLEIMLLQPKSGQAMAVPELITLMILVSLGILYLLLFKLYNKTDRIFLLTVGILLHITIIGLSVYKYCFYKDFLEEPMRYYSKYPELMYNTPPLKINYIINLFFSVITIALLFRKYRKGKQGNVIG